MRDYRRVPIERDGVRFYNPKGAVVGQLVLDEDGEAWLTKRVQTGVHQLQKPPAWCVDSGHLSQLKQIGGIGVLLVDEYGVQHRARLELFDRFGIQLDRGHGKQTALPLGHWRTTDPDGGRQLELL